MPSPFGFTIPSPAAATPASGGGAIARRRDDLADRFGIDTYCLDSLHTGRLAGGLRLLAQNAYHRLITPRGSLVGGPDEAIYGIDLTELIGNNALSTAQLEGMISNELSKDQRLAHIEVDVTRANVGASVEYTISIVATTDLGPFELVLSVDEVTTQLLKIS